jgi:nucleoside-diphosphate-sugar epimerase
MSLKILMIGGTGALSSDVVELSILRGHSVFILNRGFKSKSISKKITLLKADIKNKSQISKVLKNLHFDVVVDFLSYKVVDIKNTVSLFQDKCHQFVFISSACTYRRAKEDGIITENSPLVNESWNYSKDKVECEKYLISKCSDIGLKYTIIRPYITYGDTRIPYGIMPPYGQHWTLIERILNNKPIFIWDKGDTICNITHTADFAIGLVGLFGNPKAYNEAFHITGDEIISWKDLLYLVGKLVNKKPLLVEIPSLYAAEKLPHLKGILLGDRSLDGVFDNSKIKNAVPEFICKIPLEKGILRTINCYKDNSYLEGIDYQWDAQMDKLIYDYLKETNSDQMTGVNLKLKKYFKISFKEKYVYIIYRYFPRFFLKTHELAVKIFLRIKFFKI